MHLKKPVWIVGLIVTVVASLFISRIVPTSRATPQRLTLEAVRKQLAQATPLGSRRSAVESYLDSQSIPHSYIDDSKLSNERSVEFAVIRGTSKSLFVRGDIQTRFQFDESERLVNYSVQEVFTGP